MFFLIKKNSFNVRRVINITQEFFLTKKKQNIFSPFSPYYNIKKQIRKLHDRQIKEQTWKNPATTACSPNLQKVIEKKNLCSPIHLANKSNFINNFQQRAHVLFFLD